VLLRFLQRHPRLAVVIDHGAKPPIASGAIEDWAMHMRAIANQTQAFCKLSGLVTEAGADWSPAALQPYVEILLDAFGPRRLMWGSDWPVLHLGFEGPRHRTVEPYAAWLDVATRLVDACSDADREWIFGGTAAEFYQLR
jgi:L-fucono-1,5-lactonase